MKHKFRISDQIPFNCNQVFPREGSTDLKYFLQKNGHKSHYQLLPIALSSLFVRACLKKELFFSGGRLFYYYKVKLKLLFKLLKKVDKRSADETNFRCYNNSNVCVNEQDPIFFTLDQQGG